MMQISLKMLMDKKLRFLFVVLGLAVLFFLSRSPVRPPCGLV